MGRLLSFFAEQRAGIVVSLLALIVGGAITNWLLWMFGWGRYRGSLPADAKIRFVLADFLVKIINEFRHLLALVIFLLFSVALVIAVWPGMMKQDVTLIKDGLESVAATLGGLLGSVIGYYFGESAARRRLDAGQPAISPGPVEQQEPVEDASNIEAPPKPSSLN